LNGLTPSQVEDVRQAYNHFFETVDIGNSASLISQAKRKMVAVLSTEQSPEVVQGMASIQRLLDIAAAASGSPARHALAALAYFVDPWDIIPDEIPGAGLLDDVFVAKISLGAIEGQLGEPATTKRGRESANLDFAAGPHLAERARQLGILDAYQRRALYDLGSMASSGKILSPKQSSFYVQLASRLVGQGILETPCLQAGCKRCAQLVQFRTAAPRNGSAGIGSENRLKIQELDHELPNKMEASCPHCGKIAKGYDAIDDKFGFRVLGGKNVPQSWCRNCRAGKGRAPP
jgi:uncharacterized protein DUF1232